MKYKSSTKKIVTGLTVIFVLLILSSMFGGINMESIIEADLFAVGLVLVLGLLSLKFSYVEIADGNLKYVNLLVQRKTVPVSRILRLGYPKENWYSIYSYMYVLYQDPNKPGKNRIMQIIKGQFDESTLSKIAADLKKQNPGIEVDAELEK